MRVPLEWLADYVELNSGTDDLAHRLTMTGLKVEAIERLGADWQDVVIGQIVELTPHPKSRKPLNVTRVDIGKSTITVVTGAQNVFLGAKVAVVMIGGLLPHGPDGEPMIIERKPMVGITSEGMLASERELGLSEEHSGIMILPDGAPLGAPLRTFMGGDVLDIETNPNRPDTLSIIGIAREVAAITQQQLTLPDVLAIDDSVQRVEEGSIAVEVPASDLCPRYSALRIEGIKIEPSPFWLARRLEAAGMRPINVIVDITNYVMLEYGQPMHAFDATQLRDDTIVVRRAREGERIRTLDGMERMLNPQNLVIADAERAVAIAGVMGGEDSEIAPDTTEIVLESATFDGPSVRQTAQALGLRTEASSRFEKGLPPEQTVLGAERFVQLLAQVTGGLLRVYRLSDAWESPPPPLQVTMPMRDLHRLTGLSVPAQTAAEQLSLLGFDVEIEQDALCAAVPFWRRADIALSADVVEEVARMIGYDNIPSTLPRRTMAPPVAPAVLYWQGIVREYLLAAGATEVVTGTLTSEASMTRLFSSRIDRGDEHKEQVWRQLVPNAAGVYAREAQTLPLRLLNPPTRDRYLLRLTLLPGVLDVVSRNRRHTDEHLAFFEIASTYFKRPEDLPYERHTLAVALSGFRQVRTWQTPAPGPYSFYDMKGMLETLLEGLNVSGWHVEPVSHPALHPGRAAAICLNGHPVAFFGELHPTVADRFGIESCPVQVAEVDLDTLFAAASDVRTFHPISRYPAVHRDLAVVVSGSTTADEVIRVMRTAGDDLLTSTRIFDVYAGPPLPPETKSIAVAMEFRAPGATLTQEDVGVVVGRIIAALQEQLGASIRE